MNPISVFLKFGSLEHLEELRKGVLYMNPLSYFQKLEIDKAKRSDSNEGLLGLYQPDKIKVVISVNGKDQELSDLAGPVIVTSSALTDIHAFCLFAITPGEYEVEDEIFENNYLKIKFDSAHEKFGGYALCITHPKEFLSRVRTALEKIGKRVRSGLIEYVSEADFHGDLPEEKFGFYKLNKFNTQKEYRILIYNSGKPSEAISLNVGDLSDITKIEKWDELDIKIRKNEK